MIGVYYLSMFAGSTISGRMGGLYERVSAGRFWLLHAAVAGAGGVALLLFAPRLRRELGIRNGAPRKARRSGGGCVTK
jgi:POT family proton-dependent oligopeptide transporter